MPLDKLFNYMRAIEKREIHKRKETVSDLVNSIAIAINGKGFKEYIEQLEKGG